jgi:class 3 adenylate cyclase
MVKSTMMRAMEVPAVEYLRTDRGWVAYQTWGEGPPHVLWLSEWGTSVDNLWEHPGRIRFLSFHGSLGRVVRFDPRGQGASDELGAAAGSPFDEWRDDAIAVLDGLGIDEVVLVAEIAAAHVALRLAATVPDRVLRLALWNTWLSASQSPAESEELARYVGSVWGTGAVTAMAAPKLQVGAAPGFFGRTERLGASRAAATALMAASAEADATDIAPAIRQPVLVVHSGDIQVVARRDTEDLARALPTGRLLVSDAASFYWTDDMAEYAEFVSGRVVTAADRVLGTVLFTDIVGSTDAALDVGDARWRQILDDLDDFVAVEVHRHGGATVKQTGDGHLMTFPTPSAAVRAATAILRGARALGIQLRSGAHIGEFERRRANDIAGITVHVAARVCNAADAGEIMISRTLADLLAGDETKFEDRGDHTLKGVPGEWRLFAVVVD